MKPFLRIIFFATIMLPSAIWSQVRYDTTNYTLVTGLRRGILETMGDGTGRIIIDTVMPAGTVTSVGFTGGQGIVIGGTNPNTSSGTTGIGIANSSLGDSLMAKYYLRSDTTTGTGNIGQATLSGGLASVSTTYVKAGSFIFLTTVNTGALTNVGDPVVFTITAGTGFAIKSSNALDASKVNWFIINP